MKTPKHRELDVDFIGGQDSITKEEELAISNFIQARKQKQEKQKQNKLKPNTAKEKQVA